MDLFLYSETPDNPVFHDAKYKIGDRIKVVQVKVGHPSTFEPETLDVFQKCVGRRFTIKDIMACDPIEGEFSISYEIHVAHLNGEANCNSYLESVYLDEDEIAPVKKRK